MLKKKKFVTYDDRKWYRYFKQRDDGLGLCNVYNNSKIYDGVVISLDDPDEGRLYTLFKSYIELYNYLDYLDHTDFLNGNKNPPAFFEVILGNKPQKPHFDIEIKRDEFERDYPELIDKFEQVGEQVIKHLIQGIVHIMEYKNIQIDINKDILYYSSHNKEKRSYHIVVNNYCHIDNVEAKAFYELVKKEIKYFSEYVDPSVYSSLQQFRLLGCEKPGSGRPKIFHETFNVGKEEHTHIYSDPEINNKMAMLQESLVSFTSICQLLPNFAEQKGKKLFDGKEITIQQAEAAIDFLSDKKCFKIINITTVISLKRIRPSFCRICERTHQSENPYLTIFKENVYFHCRRSPNKMLIGKLSSDLVDEEIIESEIQKYIENNLPPTDINIDEFEDIENKVIKSVATTKEVVVEKIIDKIEEAKNIANISLPKIDRRKKKK